MSLCAVHPARHYRRTAMLVLLVAGLTGCQSLGSPGSLARVRVIEVSPDAPPMDVYQGGNAVAYNLSFGTVTSYLPVVPGTSAITVDLAGSRQVLSTVEGAFAANTHYTVLIGNPLTSPQPTILTDRGPLTVAKTQGTPTARFIHQAGRTGPVDVYLVPAGQRLASTIPIVTNLTVGANTGYLPIPACVCTTVMLPAGTPPSSAAATVHNGAQSSYQNGSARTVILLDALPTASSSVQVITTTDVDPST